jgi:hypothetical protein
MPSLQPEPSLVLLHAGKGLPPPQPLRVGIVCDPVNQTGWSQDLRASLARIPGVEIRTLHLDAAGPPLRPSTVMERLHAYSCRSAGFDAFGAAASLSAQPESMDAVRKSACDVLIWISRCKDRTLTLNGFAKQGILTIRFGEKDELIPFWDEVSHARDTSQTAIFWHDATFAEGRQVRLAETSTVQGLAYGLNSQEPVHAAIRLLAGLCCEILQQRGTEHITNLPVQAIPAAADRFPPDLNASLFVAGKLARSAQLRFAARGKKLIWITAIRPNPGTSIDSGDLSGFREVPPPAGVDWIADPFVWEHEGRNYLLYEEMPTGTMRGQLGAVEVLDHGKFSDPNTILQKEYHLSYPCVVAADGELFLMPETSEAKRIDLYRFKRFPWELELAATPLEGLPLVDTTPILVDGRWYFFTTTSRPFMETILFTSDRLDSGWTRHPVNPISCSVRNSRPAGHLLWSNGRLYRPTQDCSVRYGYAMQLNEVTRLTPTEFEERPVRWIGPTWAPSLLGTHTWNESARFQVLDGLRLQAAKP